MGFSYKGRANRLSFFPENSGMASLKSISICLLIRISDSEDTAFRSGVLSLFMLLKLCSALGPSRHRISEKRLDGYINSREQFWVQRFHQGLGNAIFNQQPPMTPPSHFAFALVIIDVFHTLFCKVLKIS